MLSQASFSAQGESFCIATADGRLRCYDCSTGRLRTTLGDASKDASTSGLANGHLTERHTCLAWAPGGGSKKEKKKKGSATTLLLAGTAAGDVKAYNTQLGELVWRSSNCIEGGVSSLAVSTQEGVVYAAGADCRVCALDIHSGAVQASFKASKHPISCIALAPDAQHMFGGSSSLALWDINSQERVGKFTGHPNPVCAIAYAPDGSHAASAGSGERSLALWPTSSPQSTSTTSPSAPSPSSSGKKAKRGGLRAAAGSLLCPDPVVALDACPSGPSTSDSGSFHLAGVSESGEAYVWQCAPSTSGRQADEEGGVEGHMVAHVRVDSSKGSQSSTPAQGGGSETILAAKLLAGTEGPILLIARGTTARPAFQSIPLSQQQQASSQQQQQKGVSSSSGAAQILLPPSSGGVLLESTAKGAKAAAGASEGAGATPGRLKHSKQDVTVLGPENQGAPMVVMGQVAAGHKRRAGDAEEEAPVPLGERAQGQEEELVDELGEEEEGVPLGERVAAMEASLEGRPAAGTSAADDGGGDADAAAGPSGSSKADSVAVLLTQALRSNDRVLLERCLATSNTRVIHNTVARIVPRDAALFLRAAVDRLLSRPARAGQLAPWLRALLHHHTGYLMAAPGAQGPLAALYQAIDGRVALYQQLLRLYGRLGLITAHSRKAGANNEGGTTDPEPEVVFEDASGDEEDEPEAEDPFALEGSGGGESEGSEDEEGSGEGGGDDSMGDEDEGLSDESDE